MAPTLDASTPAGVYNDSATLTSLVTAPFTPPSGSIVVAKVGCANAKVVAGTPTGLTFTSWVNIGTSGSTCRTAIFTATGGGASIAVTASFSGVADSRGLIVEVWTSAALAGTPATHSVLGGSGAPSDTITTAAAGSVVSWMNNDFNALDGATRAYRSSATDSGYHFLTGSQTVYGAYQSAASAGSQTYGLTAPTGQSFTMAAIEVQASGGAPAIPPILIMQTRRAY